MLSAEFEKSIDVAINDNKDDHSHRLFMRINIRCLLKSVDSSLQDCTADEIVSIELTDIVYLRDLISVS